MLKKLLCLSIASTLMACSGGELPHKGVSSLDDPIVTISAYAMDAPRRGEASCLLFTTASAEGVVKLEVDQTIFVKENGKDKRESWDTENKGRMFDELEKDTAGTDIVGLGSETIRSSCANALAGGYDVYWGSGKEVVPEREGDCYIELDDGEKFTMNECAVRVKFEEVQNFANMEDRYPKLFASIQAKIEENVSKGKVNTTPLLEK